MLAAATAGGGTSTSSSSGSGNGTGGWGAFPANNATSSSSGTGGWGGTPTAATGTGAGGWYGPPNATATPEQLLAEQQLLADAAALTAAVAFANPITRSGMLRRAVSSNYLGLADATDIYYLEIPTPDFTLLTQDNNMLYTDGVAIFVWSEDYSSNTPPGTYRPRFHSVPSFSTKGGVIHIHSNSCGRSYRADKIGLNQFEVRNSPFDEEDDLIPLPMPDPATAVYLDWIEYYISRNHASPHLIAKLISHRDQVCLTVRGDNCFQMPLWQPDHNRIIPYVDLYSATDDGACHPGTQDEICDGDYATLEYRFVHEYCDNFGVPGLDKDKDATPVTDKAHHTELYTQLRTMVMTNMDLAEHRARQGISSSVFPPGSRLQRKFQALTTRTMAAMSDRDFYDTTGYIVPPIAGTMIDPWHGGFGSDPMQVIPNLVPAPTPFGYQVLWTLFSFVQKERNPAMDIPLVMLLGGFSPHMHTHPLPRRIIRPGLDPQVISQMLADPVFNDVTSAADVGRIVELLTTHRDMLEWDSDSPEAVAFSDLLDELGINSIHLRLIRQWPTIGSRVVHELVRLLRPVRRSLEVVHGPVYPPGSAILSSCGYPLSNCHRNCDSCESRWMPTHVAQLALDIRGFIQARSRFYSPFRCHFIREYAPGLYRPQCHRPLTNERMSGSQPDPRRQGFVRPSLWCEDCARILDRDDDGHNISTHGHQTADKNRNGNIAAEDYLVSFETWKELTTIAKRAERIAYNPQLIDEPSCDCSACMFQPTPMQVFM